MQPHELPVQSLAVVFLHSPRLTWLCIKFQKQYNLPVLMDLDLMQLWTTHVMPFMMALRKKLLGLVLGQDMHNSPKLQPLTLNLAKSMREPLPTLR